VWAVSGRQRVLLALDAATGRERRRVSVATHGPWMVEVRGEGAPIVVASLDSGAVTLVDAATGRPRAFPTHPGEIDAALHPDGREVWSVNLSDGHLTVLAAADGRTVARERVGRSPGRVLFTPDGGAALIVDDGDSTVKVLDARTRARVATIAVPPGPKVIAISPDGRRAYLTHPERGALTLIDVPAATVLRTVALPGTPDGVAVLEPRPTPRSSSTGGRRG
jgi:YVTN family beta-propeller protein